MKKAETEKAANKIKKPAKGVVMRSKFVILVAVIIVVGSFAYLGNQYRISRAEVARLSNPTEAANQETQRLQEKIGKLVELPQNETPTLATVADKGRLAAQPFFKNAENGDKVLIYTQSKKAVLYRPSTDKVIEVASVNLRDGTETPAAPAEAPKN